MKRPVPRWMSVNAALASPYEHASQLLMTEPLSFLPTTENRERPQLGITVEVGRATSARQVVDVRIGTPCSAEGETWLPISWIPATLSHLLPSFDGVLEVVDADGETRLAITGTYDVPLGVVGRFGDGLVGRKVAQQSLRAVVESTARKLDNRITGELQHVAWRPPEYPVDLSEGAEREPR